MTIKPRTTWTREDGRVFPVFIDEEAMAAWLRNRDALRASGYPDRPPDVDTPTLRNWTAHPPEQALMHMAMTEQERKDAEGLKPIYAATASWPSGFGTKISVEKLDRRLRPYRITMKAGYEGEMRTKAVYEGPKKIIPALKRVWRETNEVFSAMSGMACEVMETKEADFEAAKQQLEAVVEGINAWYAERGPVQ